MRIDELIAKIKISEAKRTKKESMELLVKAGILDKDGYYDKRYFSKETVAKSKLKREAC